MSSFRPMTRSCITAACIALTAGVCQSAFDQTTLLLGSNSSSITRGDVAAPARSARSAESARSAQGEKPPESCSIECPDGGIPEGEDTDGQCDEAIDTNAGCNGELLPFLITDVACGDTICGIAWAGGGIRDTDWYRLGGHDGPTLVVATMIAEFDASFFLIGENTDCGQLFSGPFTFPRACEVNSIEIIVTGFTWWFAAPDAFDMLPCGSRDPFGNDYLISWSCSGLPPRPCPEVGDVNADGFVDFNDLLIVLADFGPCP